MLRACDFIDSQGRPLRFLPRRGRCPKGGGRLGVHHRGGLRVERPSPPPALRATSPYGGGNQESMWKWNKITSSEEAPYDAGARTRIVDSSHSGLCWGHDSLPLDALPCSAHRFLPFSEF